MRWFIMVEGEPEWASNCWFTNLSWHAAGFVTVYCYTSVISQPWWCITGKPSLGVARYHICQQPRQLLWLHVYGQTFTLKSWANFLAFYECCAFTWSGPQPPSSWLKFVLPVSSLPLMICSSTNQKLSCKLQLQSPHWVANAAFWQ